MARLRALVPVLLLVALGTPAAASDPVGCTFHCSAGGLPVCTPVEFTGGPPRLQAKPLLNLIDINLGCFASGNLPLP
ncbi:MAG TPA: hypothetical protein VHI93_01220 [Candidatus Thermoplasmatota archaeon]|nr:hypothetical protein [Candidatus Thermoplasmatota archaeon]